MYSDQKSIQILLSLLKQYGIRKIIISPGTTVTNLAGSIQNDPDFELFSSVDERSAAYMACGIAAESNEPVVLICTGATASRNYVPGLTEAYYRKLPVLAVTSALFKGNIGHNIPQMLDRTNQMNDIAKLSVQIPAIHDANDEWYTVVEINKALTELRAHGAGPVHINLEIYNAPHFSIKALPRARKITLHNYESEDYPDINDKRIGIFVGSHHEWSEELTNLVGEFSRKYDAVVLCDSTSNYYGSNRINGNIILDQENDDASNKEFDLIIHIGNTSGSYMNVRTKKVWRVNPDGNFVDTFRKLTDVFEMSEEYFFNQYNKKQYKVKHGGELQFNEWKKAETELLKKAESVDLPLSNIWIARELSKKIPENSIVHLGILSSLRSWNFFEKNKNTRFYSNTGGFGIDGCMSAMMGASLIDNDKIHYLIIGDLAFFYDLNSLGNRMIGKNLRILLVNNGCGGEFHLHINPAFQRLGHEGVGRYIAADGHFGNKSSSTVKCFVESLGFEYIAANTKQEVIDNEDYFTERNEHDKPLVLEVFTDAADENTALRKMRGLKKTVKGAVKKRIKDSAAKMLSGNAKNIIRKISK